MKENSCYLIMVNIYIYIVYVVKVGCCIFTYIWTVQRIRS